MYRLLRGKSEGKSNGAGNTQQCNGLPDNSLLMLLSPLVFRLKIIQYLQQDPQV